MTENNKLCSICRDEDSVGNLLMACQCRGTGGYTHFECLKHWMEWTGRDVCNVCRGKYRGVVCVKRPRGLVSYMWQNRVTIFSHCLYYTVQSYLIYVCLDHSNARTEDIGYNTGSQMLSLLGLYMAFDASVTLGVDLFRGLRNFNDWKETNFHIKVIQKEESSRTYSPH